MANFNNLQMAAAVCADSRVNVKKSFFGLSTKLSYAPTGSPVNVRTFELSPADGDRLRHILQEPKQSMAEKAEGFKLTPVANGNYLFETCVSQDEQFAAVMLLQYRQMSYEPVTDVLFFEGNETTAITGML